MRSAQLPLFRFLLVLLCVPALLALNGCSQAFNAATGSAGSGLAVQGKVFGGQQPVVGAHVYLYAASTSGYGSASTPLLTSAVLTNSPNNSGKDSSGNYYVTTDSFGGFSITGDWPCTAGTDIYLYAIGGNPGGYGTNPNASFMAVLGNCSNVTASTDVFLNEVTTVSSVYALSGFMGSPTQIASASTAASIAGMAAAFATYTNLVNNSTGIAYTTTPGSTTAVTGTVSTANINTLADILAACENSTGGVNDDGTTCGSLFYYSTPSGGTAATDTTQAALNIVHNPAIDPNGNLYTLISTTPPFQPSLSQAPYDWTLPIVFSGGGMNNLYDIAVDGNNNVWAISDGKNGDCSVLSASTGSDVVELTNLGVAKSGSNGYTNPDIGCPFAIAIDTSNQAWVVKDYVNYLTKISTTGTVTGYTKTGDIDYANGLAFDASGNLFLTNYSSSYLSKYVASSNTWATYSGAGLTTSGSGVSWGVAADANGHIFVASDAASGCGCLHR